MKLQLFLISACILSVPAQAQNESATHQTSELITAVEPPSVVTEDLEKIRSLFFSTGDLQTIRNARSYFEQTVKGIDKGNFSEEDFLKKLEKVTVDKLGSVPQSFTYPQFFLSSIAYYSPRDWVVWVNNEKITQDSTLTPSGLLVSYIDADKVTFEWLPQRLDKIIDINEAGHESSIKVDLARKKVHFTLKANQTFTSYAMQVVEGKVPPVTIDNNKDIVAP